MEQHKDIEQHAFNIKREVDSVDDFEHLGHDSSPLQDLLGLQQDKEVTAPETVHEINNTPKTAVSHQAGASKLLHSLQNPLIPEKMNRNLLEDDFLDRGEGKEKLDKFLQDAAIPPATSVFDHGNNKLFSANLIEAEKFMEPEKKEVDHFLDFEQEHPEPVKPKETVRHEIFEDAFKSDVPPLVPEISKEPIVPVQPAPPKPQPEKIVPSAPVTVSAPEKKVEPEKIVKKVEEKPEKIIKKVEEKPVPVVTPAKIAPTDAAAIFCKMGLDAWFNPEKLDPKGNTLDPLDSAGKTSKYGLIPIFAVKAPAPQALPEQIACKCTKRCTKNCGCRKLGISCSIFCKGCMCMGTNGGNSKITEVSEEDIEANANEEMDFDFENFLNVNV